MPVVPPVGSSPPDNPWPASPPAFSPAFPTTPALAAPAAAGTGAAGTGAAGTGENPPPGLFYGLSRSPSLTEPPGQPASLAAAGTAAAALSRYVRAFQAPPPVADLLA